MLDTALQFLKDEVNAFTASRTGSPGDVVRTGSLVNEAGKYAFEKETVCLSIVNIEEERTIKSHLREYVSVDGQHVVLEPDLKLNLQIIFAAHFKLYDVALKYISFILTYFQSHSSFTTTQYPALDQRIAKLTVELQSLTFEQLNQVWACIGGKQLPSVFYKVRLVTIQDTAQTAVQPAISGLERKYSSQ